MGWKFSDQVVLPVIKEGGKCQKISQWKYCPYWKAKLHPTSARVLGFRCSLFNKDKSGVNSLAVCNARYGKTYEGKP